MNGEKYRSWRHVAIEHALPRLLSEIPTQGMFRPAYLHLPSNPQRDEEIVSLLAQYVPIEELQCIYEVIRNSEQTEYLHHHQILICNALQKLMYAKKEDSPVVESHKNQEVMNQIGHDEVSDEALVSLIREVSENFKLAPTDGLMLIDALSNRRVISIKDISPAGRSILIKEFKSSKEIWDFIEPKVEIGGIGTARRVLFEYRCISHEHSCNESVELAGALEIVLLHLIRSDLADGS